MGKSEIKRIIHIMLDEKFNDMAIRQFEEAVPGIHEYWIVASRLILTKCPLACKCAPEELVLRLNRSDFVGVIFHSLPLEHYKFLHFIPDGKCVIWLGWGYDYYWLLNHEDEASRILPKTKSLRTLPVVARVKGALISIVNRCLPRKNNGAVIDLARVDYFSPVLDLEYKMVLRHVPLTAKYIEWNYGTAEDDLSLPDMKFSSGRNILAGNSASATNNHVELFEAIRDQVDLTGRKVVTPLSYGDPYYRDKIIDCGKLILGDSFLPLTDFMARGEYMEIMKSCGFVVMNHLRQQALGNICMAMLMGAKIYLNNGNPLMDWFKARGAVLGAIEELDMVPLTEDQRYINRRLILSHWGRGQQNKKTKQLLNAIFAKSACCV